MSTTGGEPPGANPKPVVVVDVDDVEGRGVVVARPHWLWDFGDGITSTQQHPTHTYSVANTYTVWLTAINACGSGVTSDTVTVALSPSASFTATTSVCLGQAMTFTNTGSVGTYLWTFGDGITSTAQSPTHTYAITGTFTVWLTTTNACGSDVTSNTVMVNPLPAVSFISDSPVELGETMTFTNTGDFGTYQWNFGDNSPVETSRDVTHIYSATGNYVVWLATTLGTGCWDTYSATVTVTGTIGCEDAYEPDDSRDEATTVTSPSTTHHNFDDAPDVDWVELWGTAGATYIIETLNLATNVDTKLNFYSWDGSTLTLLASNDDRNHGDLSSLITWAVTTDGWYYVEVGRFTGSYYGCDAYCDLRISSPTAYVYLPIILKNHASPELTSTPPSATPMPSLCYPLVETPITVGNDPRGVAYNSDDRVIYVANYVDGTVSVINGVTYGVIGLISGVTGANGVAYDSTHNLVYVSMLDSAQLAVIDASTNTVSETVSVGNGPNGVAYNPTANKIYVANYADHTVTMLNGDTRALITTVAVPGETDQLTSPLILGSTRPM